ncbi:lytic transglycosylase domain-containing protein [Flavobacterium sp.]|uniref:lytic transglycosylase domain-containing protein n=1 Tax=Flavobacterium sp. TaxID=239 RepID=UPI00286EAC36|nr:lytic transglycosylase domain-containing protein [Flavobacterium sp.]
MKAINKIVMLIGILFLSGILIYATSNDTISKIGTPNYFPEKIDFAGEETPLQIADVHERMDRELLINANLHSSTILILKRANKFFPIIEPILARNNVPDDFKYLAVIESSLITTSVSKAGASGIWQFMSQTAREKGLEVSENVDERYHLEKATEAACKYLLAAKERFGSWTLAAASYNGGTAGISNKIQEQQVSNYYDLLLVDETSRYVFRILALKEIMKNPTLYGFDLKTTDLYKNQPIRKIEIDSSINNLALFAKNQGINYKILKQHNPWLRDKKLDNLKKKTYTIEIPTSGY